MAERDGGLVGLLVMLGLGALAIWYFLVRPIRAASDAITAVVMAPVDLYTDVVGTVVDAIPSHAQVVDTTNSTVANAVLSSPDGEANVEVVAPVATAQAAGTVVSSVAEDVGNNAALPLSPIAMITDVQLHVLDGAYEAASDVLGGVDTGSELADATDVVQAINSFGEGIFNAAAGILGVKTNAPVPLQVVHEGQVLDVDVANKRVYFQGNWYPLAPISTGGYVTSWVPRLPPTRLTESQLAALAESLVPTPLGKDASVPTAPTGWDTVTTSFTGGTRPLSRAQIRALGEGIGGL